MKKASFTSVAAFAKGLVLVAMTFVMSNQAQAQCALVCNNLSNVSLDEDCIVPITHDMILNAAATSCPAGTLSVDVYKNAAGTGGLLPTSPNVTSTVINQTLLVKVKQSPSGNSCWGYIHVEDKLAPDVDANDIFLMCTQSNQAIPVNTTITENCTSTLPPTRIDETFDLPCDGVVGHLTGQNEVPAIETTGGGLVEGTFNDVTNVLTLEITYANLSSNLAAGHIHTGAAGANGPVAVDLFGGPFPALVANQAGTLNRTLTLTAAQEISFKANGLYVNLHTVNNPGGELRAQLLTEISAFTVRKWTVTDLSGNHATGQQAIFYQRKHVQDVTFPADVIVDCADAADWDTHPDGTPDPSPSTTGAPSVGGFSLYPNNTACELNVAYTDQFFDICPGSYKVLRTWVVYDWCLPTGPVAGVTPPVSNPRYYIQVIKVLDTTAPVLTNCPAPDVVSIDPWDCDKDYDLPTITVTEDCSEPTSAWAVYTNTTTWVSTTVSASIAPDPNWTGNWLVNYGVLQNLPIGDNSIELYVRDACGNTSDCTILVNVFDGIEPVAICQEVTQVSVGAGYVDNFTCSSMAGAEAGPNGPANDIQGETIVPAASFNSGSYDKCNPVYLKVRRMDGKRGCNPQSVFSNFFDEVYFCCSDIGQDITVQMRIYDVNPGVGEVGVSALDGHWNECMVQVLVEDKVKPVCQAPANKTVDCEQWDPLVWYGNLTFYDNCGIKNIDTSITYDGVASGSQAQEKASFEQCNYGRVTRRFTVTDCAGNSSACTQTLTVSYKEQYRVEWPADRTISFCDSVSYGNPPAIFAENCEVIGVSHEDQVFTVVPDACYKIIRRWCVINWCTYNPTLGEVLITKQNANSLNGPNTWIGNFWGHAVPNPAGGFIIPSAGQNGGPLLIAVPNGAINASQLSNPGTPAYCYNQVIKVQDQQDPRITQGAYNPCDYTDNDPDGNNPLVRGRHAGLWNATAYWDPACSDHDLCEGVKQIYIDADDACSKGEVNARYQLFLDLNGDGVMETVVNSETPSLRFGIGTEYIAANGSSNSLPFISGSVNDPVLTVNNGTTATPAQITAAVKRRFYVTRDAEWDSQFPQSNDRFLKDIDLPYGNHKIKWTVEDNCGNDFTTEYTIKVQDCKKPTIICKPLAGPIMNGPAAMVTVWATDWVEYAEDNCCLEQGWFSVRKEGAGFGSGVPPLTSGGGPVTSVTFTCTDGSANGFTQVEIWTKDKAGNYDYCVTYIQLNKQNCPGNNPQTASVSGALKTDAQAGLEAAKVKVTGSAPGFPNPEYFTGVTGTYDFTAVPMGNDYLITPTKGDNLTNGVSTYDLVLISKHILGSEMFNTPYKFVAGDVNKSGHVSTADIVDLRKTILGIASAFPNNDSWRFVSKDYNFTTTNPAGEAFPEKITVGQLGSNLVNKDFVSVKIGDINGNATANGLMSVDDRTNGKLMFDVKEQAVKAGEEFTVAFKAAEKVAGYQFTLNFEGLTVSNVAPGAGMSKDNFAVFAQENAITTSFDGNVAGEFAITFRADRDGKVSEMLALSNRITAAQAYSTEGENLEVAFRFDGGKVAGVAFELYQNTPNPVKDVTSISFNMPEAGAATVTITDAQGRVLVQNTINNCNKGTNTFNVNRAQLASGVLFYEVATETAKAAKKMIVVE